MSLWQQKRILITGGSGFIGSHLARRLIQEGAILSLLDPHAQADNPNIKDFASLVTCLPLRLSDALDKLDLSAFDIIFHLAGNASVPASVQNPSMDFEKNLSTTFKLLEGLRANPQVRLIYASSAAVYGNPRRLPIHESDHLAPLSPYGVSKLACENYVAIYSKLYGIRASSVRMFSLYGPGLQKQVVFDIFQKLRANPQFLEIVGDGSQERDFCHIDDAVEALLTLTWAAPAQGEVYNLASGVSHSIKDLVELWCRLLKLKPEISYTELSRPGEPDKWLADISALKQLGYAPTISLEQGLISVKEWYESKP